MKATSANPALGPVGTSPAQPVLRERRPRPDPFLLLAVAALLGLGWVMVLNATYFGAAVREGNPLFYTVRHTVYLVVGIALATAAARVRLEAWQRLARPLFFGTVFLLLLVLHPHLGAERGGASRWIELKGTGLTFQPSELAKFALVLQLARFFGRRPAGPSGFWSDILPPLTWAGVMAGLVLAQPDFGTSAILFATALAMLFAAGAPRRYFVLFGAGAIAAALVAIWVAPYRMSRVLCFLDPWADRRATCFQLMQSLIAFAVGGWSGVGLGESRQKLFFLPEAHTDFIFAVIGEELGVLGASLVIALFACIAVRGFRIAYRERDPFASYLAFGITFSLVLEAVLNAGVVLGMLPTKGLVMPFLSYGGSALIFALVRAGVLLQLSRRTG